MRFLFFEYIILSCAADELTRQQQGPFAYFEFQFGTWLEGDHHTRVTANDMWNYKWNMSEETPSDISKQIIASVVTEYAIAIVTRSAYSGCL